jgi:hypothetical protein
VLGATGNVGGRIVQLLIKNPLCKKVVVVTDALLDLFLVARSPGFASLSLKKARSGR